MADEQSWVHKKYCLLIIFNEQWAREKKFIENCIGNYRPPHITGTILPSAAASLAKRYEEGETGTYSCLRNFKQMYFEKRIVSVHGWIIIEIIQ